MRDLAEIQGSTDQHDQPLESRLKALSNFTLGLAKYSLCGEKDLLPTSETRHNVRQKLVKSNFLFESLLGVGSWSWVLARYCGLSDLRLFQAERGAMRHSATTFWSGRLPKWGFRLKRGIDLADLVGYGWYAAKVDNSFHAFATTEVVEFEHQLGREELDVNRWLTTF